MFGNKSWLCACASLVEWDGTVARPEVRQTQQSAWRHVCCSVGWHGGPVEPDRYFSFVQTRSSRYRSPASRRPCEMAGSTPAAAVDAVRVRVTRSVAGCTTIRWSVRPTITVLGRGDQSTVFRDTYKI